MYISTACFSRCYGHYRCTGPSRAIASIKNPHLHHFSTSAMAKLVHNVQKKQHKERSQTLNRQRFGFLEKKKDYRLRAADFHKKEAALKALRAKAAEYNPDEYYHAMKNKRTDDDGIIIHEAPNPDDDLTPLQLKLLKSQDVNYVKTMRLNEAQKIKKLKEQLGFRAGGKHTVFVDDEEKLEKFNPAEYFQTDESMLGRRENRLRVKQLEDSSRPVRDIDGDEREQLEKEKLVKFRLLKERIEREKQLRQVEERLETERELMKGGTRTQLVDDNGRVHYKWKSERKK